MMASKETNLCKKNRDDRENNKSTFKNYTDATSRMNKSVKY